MNSRAALRWLAGRRHAERMRTLGWAATLAMLVGCGGGDGPNINGNWLVTLNDVCALGASFDTQGKTYVGQTICQLTSGGFADELEEGDADFSVQGKISIVPRRASCPTSDHSPGDLGYTFQGANLAISYPSGVVILARSQPSAGTAVAAFGCINMGQFEAHPIQDL